MGKLYNKDGVEITCFQHPTADLYKDGAVVRCQACRLEVYTFGPNTAYSVLHADGSPRYEGVPAKQG